MIVMSVEDEPDDGPAISFERYVAEHGAALLRHATVLTADHATAQDVVQAVLERAYTRWPTIAAVQFVDAYVRRMVTNEAITMKRRWSSRIHLTALPPDASPVSDTTEQHAERDALIARLRRLPPRQRAVLVLRYFEDMSDAQIAFELGCTESTVRGYVLRGLRALRIDLDERTTATLETR